MHRDFVSWNAILSPFKHIILLDMTLVAGLYRTGKFTYEICRIICAEHTKYSPRILRISELWCKIHSKSLSTWIWNSTYLYQDIAVYCNIFKSLCEDAFVSNMLKLEYCEQFQKLNIPNTICSWVPPTAFPPLIFLGDRYLSSQGHCTVIVALSFT